MNSFTQFFKVLLKRLISADWKTAGAEVTVFGGSLTVIVADFSSHDFIALLKDFPEFWAPVLFFIGAFRSIISSNDKAILNPALPKIDGVLSTAPKDGADNP